MFKKKNFEKVENCKLQNLKLIKYNGFKKRTNKKASAVKKLKH